MTVLYTQTKATKFCMENIAFICLQSCTRGIYGCQFYSATLENYHNISFPIFLLQTTLFNHCISLNWSKAVFNRIKRRKYMMELKKHCYNYQVSRIGNRKKNGCFFLKMANNRVFSVKNSPRLLLFFI